MKNNNNSWKLTFQIFWSFLKIAPITFGGGYAIIPVIENEVVNKKKWVKEEDISDVLTISQTIPGAIGVNSATFIGYHINGIRGAMAALIGITLPTFFIVILMALSFLTFQDNPIVAAAFQGIRAAIVALILYAGLKIAKSAVKDWTTLIIAVLAIFALLLFNFHPFAVIILGAMYGIFIMSFRKKLSKSS